MAKRAFLTWALALCVLACRPSAVPQPAPTPAAGPDPGSKYIIAAHYYSWFPEAFENGYLRACLTPPQQPELGLYDSYHPQVARQHIDWAAEYGIDVFVLDFWPSKSRQEKRHDVLLEAPNIGDIKFCILYESADLGYRADLDATHFDQQASARLVEDLVGIADRYFSHPQYYRVNGRPMVILYITRTFTGDYRGAIEAARAALKAAGHDVFLVADEVYWSSQPEAATAPGKEPTTDLPQRGRIRLFDALTAYNFYSKDRPQQAGYGSRSSFLAEVSELTDRYVQATDGQVPVLPSVIPGYNDRGRRLKEQHGVIPRQWREGDAEGSFLEQMLERYALPSVDPRLPLVFVTSWNEWNEDTSIEPARLAPPTTQDKSGRQAYTSGYLYDGYGTAYLRAIRNKVVAVSGVARDRQEQPLVGQTVSAWRGDRLVATDVTDGQGRFHLSRMTMSPGTYLVGTRRESAERVRVSAAVTATEVKLHDGGGDRVVLDLGEPGSRTSLVSGFSNDEKEPGTTFVWSLGETSILALPLKTPSQQAYVLGVRSRALPPLSPASVTVFLNDYPLGKLSSQKNWSQSELAVPAGAVKPGKNLVRFVFEKTARPLDLGDSTDHRELAVSFDRVWLIPQPASP